MESMAAHSDADRTICLTGPESTGKTTLARALASRLGATLVPEIAREYLGREPLDQRRDLLEIARRQVALERETRAGHAGLLICDTDLLVIQIWWREKFGPLPTYLAQELSKRSARGYLLLEPDISWQADPLRENPTDRDRLFELYRAELEASGFPHRIVGGLGEARVERAIEQLQSLCKEV